MIELIVVIVILGILAATALPKFIDLRTSSASAAAQGLAGNLSSAMSVNYAACSSVSHMSTANPTVCTQVKNCTDGATLLTGGLPASTSVTYAITSAAIGTGGTGNGAGNNGVTLSCSLVGTLSSGSTVTGTFSGISAGN